MKALTERQRAVFEYIKRYKAENDMAPTFREIAEHFGVSITSVYEMMKFIRKKGLLSWKKEKIRTIRIINNPGAIQD